VINDSIRSYADVMNGDELAKQLMAEVHRSAEIRVTDNDTHEKLEDIKKILEGIDKNLSKEMKELGETIERTARDLTRGPGSSGASAGKTKPLNMGNLAVVMSKTYNAINNLNKTLGAGVTVNMSKALEKALSNVGGGGGMPSGGGGSGGGWKDVTAAFSGSAGDGEKRLTKMNAVLVGTTMVVDKALSLFSKGLSGIGVDLGKAFRGVIKDGVEHVQQMRSVIYMTQGAGVAMTDMEKDFINIRNISAETGKDWQEGAALYRKEMQKGLTTEVMGGKIHQRTAQDAMRLTKNSLRTANMIGASAEGTAELFSEWNRHLGMTNSQLGFVGREMEQIAKNSGMTGDELLAATKAASILVKEVRNFAGISEHAMAQIIQTQTSLKKFGAEDIGAKFNQAMSQGVRSLAQAEPVIASIIAEAAQKAGISMTGSMLTGGKQQRDMLKSINDTLRGRLGAIGLGGVDPAKLLDKLEEMRDAGQDTGMLEQQIKNITGMGAGELQNFYKANQEASKSYSERMQDFNSKIAGATTQEGRSLATKQRDDYVKLQETQQSSTFTRMLGNKGNTEDAIKQYNQRAKKEGFAEISGPGGEQKLVEKGFKNLTDRAKVAGVDIDAELKKRGLTRDTFQKGLLDPKMTNEFQAIGQELENMTATQEKANQDPVAKAMLELRKVNEKLTNAVQSLYMSFVTFEAVMAAAVALMAAKAGLSILSMPTGLLGKGGKMLGGLGRGAGRMLGLGGRAGGAVAAEAGTAAVGQVAGRAAARGGTALAGRAAARGGTALAGRAAAGVAGRAAGGVAAKAGAGILGRLAGGLGAKALAGAGAKVAGLALGASNPIGWVVTLATALGGGFVNAMEAASKATEIFNTTQDKLTYTQKAAAKSAGFLTGVLDFITFGIFSDYIGPTGTWTVALAKFFDQFWPLAMLGDILLKPWEILWSVVKGIGLGIWEYWKGLYDGFMAVWTPINEAFTELKTAILEPIVGVFEEVFGAGAANIDMMQSISDAFKTVGKWAGDLARWVGGKLGEAIRFLTPFIKTAAQWISSYLVPAFKGLFTHLKGLWKIVSGIFTLDGSKIWDGIKDVFARSPQLFWDAIKAFFSLFIKGIPLALGALWQGLKMGFMWLVTDLPKLLLQGFLWIVTDLPKMLWDGFMWIVTELPGFLMQGFSWVIDQLPQALWDGLAAGFSWITTDLPNMLIGVFQQVMDFILGLIPGRETAGKLVDAGSKLMEGDVSGAAGSVLDAGKSAVNGLTNNALTRAIGLDFELFDVGSRGVVNDGLAYLHKGEMVVPAGESKVLQQKATSKGTFASASNAGLFDKGQGKEANTAFGMGGLLGAMVDPFGLTSMIMEPYQKAFNSLTGGGENKEQTQQSPITIEDYLVELVANSYKTNELLKTSAGMLNAGLFDTSTVSDAIYESSVQTEKEFDSMFGSADAVQSVIVEAQEVLLGNAYASDQGLFAPENITEAMDVSNTDIMQQQSAEKPFWERMMESAESFVNKEPTDMWNTLTRTFDEVANQTEKAMSNPIETGLFAASNARDTFYEAMQGTINNPVGRLMDMFGVGPNTASASAGNSLYYNNQSEYSDATSQTGAAGGTTNNYVNQGRRVRGLPVKGGVSSNLLSNSRDVEDYIVQNQLLSQPSGGSGGMAMPILERIAEAVESGRLDEIITLLTAIRDKSGDVLINTGGRTDGSGAPSVENSGMREGYNKSWLNGDWTHLGDPAYSDNANILGTSR
jgi:hypothetical protein